MVYRYNFKLMNGNNATIDSVKSEVKGRFLFKRFHVLIEVISKGRQERKVKARSLLCFWASRELGMSHTSLAKKLEMSLSNIGLSVERGESIVKDGSYSLEK